MSAMDKPNCQIINSAKATKSAFGRWLALAAVTTIVAGGVVRADSPTWDPLANHTGSDGSGTWDNSTPNWATGSGDIAWSVGDFANIGSGGTAGIITLGATVNTSGITFNPVVAGSNYTIAASGSYSLILANGSGAYIDMNLANATISAPIQLYNQMNIGGTGTLTISGGVNFEGNNSIQIGMGNASATPTLLITATGGGSNTDNGVPGNITLYGGTFENMNTAGPFADVSTPASSTIFSISSIGVNLTNTFDVGATNQTLDGSISQSSTDTFVLQDGTINLGANNAGSFTAGTLKIGNGSAATNVIFGYNNSDNLPANNVPIALDGASLTQASVNNPISVDVVDSSANTIENLIQLTGANTVNAGTLYNLTLAGNISGAGSLTVNGDGLSGDKALIMTGNNSYTGGTTVKAGTLVLGNNNAVGTGALAVDTGGQLETAGARVGSGAALNINAGSYAQQIGSTLTLLANSSTLYDSLQLGNGSASLNGTLNLIFAASFTPSVGQTYNLINTTGSVSGSFSSIVLTGAGNLQAAANFENNVGEVISIINPIPTLIWSPSGAADGAGNWDTTSATNWNPGQVVWNNGDFASIGGGGAGNIITIDGPVTVAGMTFNTVTSPYTIAASGGNALTLSNSSGDVAIVMNASATISAGITLDTTANVSGVGTLNISGNIIGAGAVNVEGAGTLVLSGTNTYTGGTAINGGVLSISADDNLGDSSGSLAFNGGTLQTTATVSDNRAVTLYTSGGTIDTDGQSDIFSGAISGNGGLTVTDSSGTGNGVLTLSGANTYIGSTTISTGTLALSGSGSIADSSAVTLASNTDLDISQSTSGVTLSALNDAGSTGDKVSLGAKNLTVTVAGANTYDYFNGVIQDGGIVNSTGGSFTKGGAGTMVLSGTNTYTGGTTITGGTLDISTDANLGAASGTLTLYTGTLNYTGGGGTLANSINVSGTGGTTSILENSGTGTETLTGAITDSTAGNILALSGGTFNLNDNSSSTFTAGTVQIGDAPTTVIVTNADAFGSGAILLTSGSTLETSGFNTGTGTALTITAGTFTQQSNSALALLVTASSTTLGSSTNDSINLGSGNASLNGQLDLSFAAGSSPANLDQYIIIGTSGTVSGNFSSIDLIGTSGLRGVTSFDNSVGEIVTLYNQYFLNLSTFTPNETAVADYLNAYALQSGTPQAVQSSLNVVALLSEPQQEAYLDELVPQVYSQLQDQSIENNTFMAQEIFSQVQNVFTGGGFNTSGLALLKTGDQDPFTVSMDAAMQSAQQQANHYTAYMDNTPVDPASGENAEHFEPDNNIFHSFSGYLLGTITVDQQQSDNAISQHFTTHGLLAGLDYRLNSNLMMGGFFNWGYSSGALDNYGSRQQSNSYTPGIVVGYKLGDFYVNALAAYTYNSYQINRNIFMPGSSTVATGNPTGNEYDTNGLLGYNLPLVKGLVAGPAAGVGFTQVNIGGFSESGSPFALTVAKQDADSLRSLLGMQGQYILAMDDLPMRINISFNAFWQHEYLNSARDITAAFNQFGTGSFVYQTTGSSGDSALVGLGADGYLTKDVSVFVNYEVQVGQHSQFGQTAMVGLAMSF